MPEANKRSSIFQYAFLFLAIYVGLQLLTGVFFPSQTGPAPAPGPVLTAGNHFTIGTHPTLTLTNRPATTESFGMMGWIQSKICTLQRTITGSPTPQDCARKAAVHTGAPYVLDNRCPQPPVDVFRVENRGTPQETVTPMASGDTAVPCEPIAAVGPGESVPVSLGPWKYSLFEKVGTYEVRLPGTGIAQPSAAGQSGSVVTSETDPTVVRFAISEPGFFTKIFRTFITAPFLNFLIFIASHTPGYNLGIAIILLTLAVKILLFFPTQHALEGQKKMQMLQPKLEALKAKYKGDAKRIQEETMKLWKEHKINPLQSCLPMLIQFPILIGLFYVIRDGSDLALSRHLIYGPYQDLPWHFGTWFLGLNLLVPNIYVMPLLLVVMQFLQMKLTFSIQKRKKDRQDIIDVAPDGKTIEKQPASPQDVQQKMMLYGLPLMIGIFALQFPAAVALYWGVSTLFAIGQQIIVNREHLRV